MEIMLYLYTNWVRITSVSMVLDLDIEFFFSAASVCDYRIFHVSATLNNLYYDGEL